MGGARNDRDMMPDASLLGVEYPFARLKASNVDAWAIQIESAENVDAGNMDKEMQRTKTLLSHGKLNEKI